MPRRHALCALALLMLSGLPATPAAANPAARPEFVPEPPDDLIDFLGRRRECSYRAPEPGQVRPPPGSWQEWLRCDALAEEESALRSRYADDADAMSFLNQPPESFRLDRIFMRGGRGAPDGDVERAEQRGLDSSRRVGWQVVLDRQATDGRATSVSASWGTRPTRTIFLDNARFPFLDLGTASVALEPDGPRERLLLDLRYGFGRGWCGDVDPDDRPSVSVDFTPDDVSVYRQDRTNCGSGYEEVDADAFSAPPPAADR